MRRHSVLRMIRMKLPGPAVAALLLLALCFLVGGFVALIYFRACDEASCAALADYLLDYCLLYEQSRISVSFWKCVRLYFGGVILAFLMGYSSLGLGLIPLLSGVFGFTSFYTVACFVQTFGRPGIFAAAALLGVRLVFTVPCFFAVAGVSLRLSLRLAALAFGNGKAVRVQHSGHYGWLLVCCFVLLCVGVCCERFVTPYLFRTVMDRMDFIFGRGGVS